MSTCVTPDQIKAYLLSSLEAFTPCMDDMSGSVDAWWTLLRPLAGCDNELTYLLVRKEALSALMMCAAYQVDTRTGNSNTNYAARSKTNSVSWAQAQSTSQSNNHNDFISEDKYDDVSDSSSGSGSSRLEQHSSYLINLRYYRDTGHGESHARNAAKGAMGAYSTSMDHATSATNGVTRGYRGGCTYSYEGHRDRAPLRLSLSLAIVSFSITNNAYAGSSGRTHTAYMQNSGGQAHVAGSEGEDKSERQASNEAGGSHTEYFNAHVDEHQCEVTGSRADDNSQSEEHRRTHAEGFGYGHSRYDAAGNTSSQGSSQQHSDAYSESTGSRNSASISTDLKKSQYFQHLKDLLANTKELITYKRKLLQKRMGYGIGQMLYASCDGYCCIAHQSAIQTPCGTCAPAHSIIEGMYTYEHAR